MLSPYTHMRMSNIRTVQLVQPHDTPESASCSVVFGELINKYLHPPLLRDFFQWPEMMAIYALQAEVAGSECSPAIHHCLRDATIPGAPEGHDWTWQWIFTCTNASTYLHKRCC